MSTVELYGRDIPKWARVLGVFGVEYGGRSRLLIRCRWAEFSWCFPKIALELDASEGDDHSWHIHIALLFFQAFIYLPLPPIEIKIGEMHREWGFSWLLDREFGYGDIHLHWNYRCKIIHMPWHMEWVRTSYLLPSGMNLSLSEWPAPHEQEWAHETIWQREPVRGFGGLHLGRLAPWEWDRWRNLPKWEAKYPYRYVMKRGEVQDRIATVRVEEREWRWRWFKWLPWPRMVRRTISVDFSDEVGERSGSWKGGTVGCGYDLRPGETPLVCLRRMERERKF